MAVVMNARQKRLFSWYEIGSLSDLKRLQLVLDNLPDERLMRQLERDRGPHGRDDYPVRAMWNSLIAQVVYQHPSVQSLRRELLRNGQLRWMCGFEGSRVPPASAYSRFKDRLIQRQEQVRANFYELVRLLGDE